MTTRRTEVLAGVTTFLTMSYVVIVNPAILSTKGTGLGFAAVLTATALVAAISSVLMGVWARLPYALAPGMGINAFFTFSMILGDGLSGRQALGAVTASGALFVALSLTPARSAIARAIPPTLRHAAAAGIGLFLVFIGLKNAGVVVGHPVTFVAPGAPTVELGLFVAGLLATVVLVRAEVKGALLLAIVGVTLAGAALGRVAAPTHVVQRPDFSLLFACDLRTIWRPAFIAPILTILFTDLFDSLSTFLGVAHAAGLVDDHGEPLRLERALTVDAVATLLSGLLGTSSATTYIESAAGIRAGGRSGLTAVVAGLCFVPLLFLAPLAQVVPGFATAPALVFVGFSMLGNLRELASGDPLETVPALLCVAIMPLTFSITQGLTWGLVSYVGLALLGGRARRIPLALWLVAALCLALRFL